MTIPFNKLPYRHLFSTNWFWNRQASDVQWNSSERPGLCKNDVEKQSTFYLWFCCTVTWLCLQWCHSSTRCTHFPTSKRYSRPCLFWGRKWKHEDDGPVLHASCAAPTLLLWPILIDFLFSSTYDYLPKTTKTLNS